VLIFSDFTHGGGFDVTDVDISTLAMCPNKIQPIHDLTIPAEFVKHVKPIDANAPDDMVNHFDTSQCLLENGPQIVCWSAKLQEAGPNGVQQEVVGCEDVIVINSPLP